MNLELAGECRPARFWRWLVMWRDGLRLVLTASVAPRCPPADHTGVLWSGYMSLSPIGCGRGLVQDLWKSESIRVSFSSCSLGAAGSVCVSSGANSNHRCVYSNHSNQVSVAAILFFHLILFLFFLSLAAASITREDAKCSSKRNTSQTFGVNLMFLKSGFNALPSENELQTTP